MTSNTITTSSLRELSSNEIELIGGAGGGFADIPPSPRSFYQRKDIWVVVQQLVNESYGDAYKRLVPVIR